VGAAVLLRLPHRAARQRRRLDRLGRAGALKARGQEWRYQKYEHQI
jgi:hypothetical protein